MNEGKSRALSFFRLVWRWHFWAGLIATPTLIVVSVTGGLIVFKDDLLDWQRSHLVFVEPQTTTKRPLDEQLARVRMAYPEAKLSLVTIAGSDDRATMVQLRRAKEPTRICYVNPYSAEVLGDVPLLTGPFWPAVLTLHQSLFVGMMGRIIVELTTAWTVVLVVSGIYLWIPKHWRIAGVLWPRFRSHRYTVLRDLHTIPGVYLAFIAVILCLTGMFFSPVFRETYRQITGPAGQYPLAFTQAPKATPTPIDASPVPLSQAVDAAQQRYPGHRLMILAVREANEPYSIIVNGRYGPTVVGFLAMDRTTGEIVADNRYGDLPILAKVQLWVYPLHVGSVGGITTKVLAALTCLMLAVAAVTGVWMWLVRRRSGRTGFPYRPEEGRVPVIGGIAILIMAILMPTVGISLLIVLGGEWAYGKLTRTC
jgi:uncharacterized iron-regulated membrane protein